ncbi:hypothetical protein BD626DRAFT_472923 [Schizophyllum amplum]|uniref:J domain-containing protein n=1 Tax=Schizophyllum amplum TaxID=97359 RepID=A0A550CWD7_9AGAR|nr:hypothetical protein BD626DRAFT_472923 [Auriculariopsis ampla]
MGKLHLKRTPEEELASRKRKQRRLDKKRRKEEPYSTKRVRPADYDYVFDTSGLPQPHHDEAHGGGPSEYYTRGCKRDPEVLNAELEEQAFRDRMFDALGDDERLDGVEAQFNDYAHVPHRWGGSTTRKQSYENEDSFLHTDPQYLDDEEYAEWVRLGMYRKTHAAEYAEQERQKAAKAARKAEERARRKETRRLEKAAAEERRLHKAHKHAMRFVEARERYEKRWNELLAEPNEAAASLMFADIPWPVLAAYRHEAKDHEGSPLTVEDLTLDSISAFLLPVSAPAPANAADTSVEESRKKERKERLRASYLRFHPDKFEGRLMKRIRPEHQEEVKSAVGAVVRALNTLMSDY